MTDNKAKLILDGTPVVSGMIGYSYLPSFRYTVYLCGCPCLLQYALFAVLCRLAHARITTEHGWVEAKLLDPNAARYIYRLRRELYSASIVQNDRCGHYRLILEADQIQICESIRLVESPELDALFKQHISEKINERSTVCYSRAVS